MPDFARVNMSDPDEMGAYYERLKTRLASKVKPRFSLLPHKALRAVAFCLTVSAQKHGDTAYRERTDINRELDSLQRHLNSYQSGEEFDPDSHLSHLIHMATRSLIAVEIYLNKIK